MRFVWLVLFVATTASAYPLAATGKSREAEFRKRNPEVWTTVEINARGFVTHAVTADTTVVATDLLRANADLFGFAPEVVDQIPSDGLLTEELDGAMIGEIDIHHYGTTLDITVYDWLSVTPKIQQASVEKRVAGARYTETVGYGMPAMLDCGMTALGAAGCKTKALHHRTRQLTIDPTAAQTYSLWFVDGKQLRLVVCSNVLSFEDPDPDPSWGNLGIVDRTLVPIGDAPHLPLVVDRVTGKTLATRAKSCSDPIFGER